MQLAIVPPQDSSYGIAIRKVSRRLGELSGGRLRVEIYSGAVLGDEPRVAEKVKQGALEAGGFTGLGLGKIAPEIRILELPFLFQSYQELEYIQDRYFSRFAQTTERNGVKLLSLADYGRINIWSNFPIQTLADALRAKLWIWKGDVLAEAITSALEMPADNTFRLEVPEVASALQDGRVNLVYITASGLILLGWYPYVTHVVTETLTRPVMGFVANLKFWNSLPQDLQQIISTETAEMMKTVRTWVSRDDRTAYVALVKRGIQTSPFGEAEMAKFRKKMERLWYDLADKLYPRSLLDSILADLEEFRRRESTAPPP